MDFGKKKMGGDALGNGRLLQEIEAIHRALYRDGNPVKPARSISAGKTHQQFVPDKTKSRALRENTTSSSSTKEKKSSSSSIWNWKPLKALSSHVRNRRFNCSFSLHVHSVESLPPTFNDLSLRVYWKRRDGGLETRSARVLQGIAEFEETLVHSCKVYGTRSGPHHSAKYEAKHFLVFAGVVGNAELDLGKHRIDLTRLLPLTLEELNEEKSSGKWTTSFKLSGKAKGAILNVSFGFLVLGDGRKVSEPSSILKQSQSGMTKSLVGLEEGDGKVSFRRVGSLQGPAGYRVRHPSRSVEDVKLLHEVLPSSKSDVTSSLTFENINLEPEFHHFTHKEPNFCLDADLESKKENCENASEEVEFNVIERGIEIDEKGVLESNENEMAETDTEAVNLHEIGKLPDEDVVNLHEIGKVPDEDVTIKDALSHDHISFGKSKMPSKESVMEDLDAALRNISTFEVDELESPPSQKSNYNEIKSGYKAGKVGNSLSLDDVTESVASEFFTMLGLEHSPFGLSSDSDPESPRERLWKQFKKDTLSSGEDVFGICMGKEIGEESANDFPVHFDLGEFSEDFELSSISHAADTEYERVHEAPKSKTRAKMLEDLETEALMHEWGMNEKAFWSSPPDSASGFGSPINLPPEEPLKLPPLGEGLGPCLQMKDGGFLRSMNPTLFGNAKNNASLVMQVSSPVVIPAEMGSGIMEILQHLASVGIEKLSMQASKLMPLEDITGKTMQQVAWEAAPSLEAGESQEMLHQLQLDGTSADGGRDFLHGRKKGRGSSKLNLSSVSGDTSSEYVSLEDLAPLAMEKIETLSIEGLKIQSGMSDQEAPSNICPQSIGEICALEGMKARSSGLLGLGGTAGMQLLDIKDSNEGVDGLMGLSLSLDEWMKLDAGVVDEEDHDSGRTSKVLAAHRANCTTKDLISGRWKGEERGRKDRKWGLLGNNFTVSLMVQLRDPLRNYEPVGTPMLALIQVERVFVPPKPKIYYNVSQKGNSEEVDEPEPVPAGTKEDKKEEKKEEEEAHLAEVIPQFKITEVHVAGIKTEPTKKKLWGSSTQQQSGSRWLLGSGMGKSNKHAFMKSKTATKSPQVASTTVQPGDTLWSISARVHGTGAKWKELAALNPHIRNPNVILPNETIRLR
ncbi:protein PLASTID MOVEMENT IMPAIRED 1-RELATED 1-like [Aristolochia californica]|uniref:protein PLASTID MOVEMENT IMPAIRED 1-RELATED 1-like n=1 Tax=Aristolochia californica TaxID=171875 RepID=UPI0035D64222